MKDAPVDDPPPRPRRHRFIRGLKISILCAVGLLVAALATMRVALHATPGIGKQPPAGYTSIDMIALAFATGQLDTIDVNIALPASVEFREAVEYGIGGEVPLKLDLYLPKDLQGLPKDIQGLSKRIQQPPPALVFVHGGGWERGNRNDYRYYCIKFAERGYVVATISYRLRDVALFPAAIEDAKCAVRWMRANAESLGADPNRIAIIGGSAGGHLAMMVGYSVDDVELEGIGGHEDVSSRVQAVVNFYGPTDLTTPYARTHETITGYLGKSYDEAPEMYDRGSPLHHVSADDPPTLIFHGSIDELVPLSQAERLAQALDDVGVAHAYYPLDGWPHAMDVAQVVNDFCIARMLEFFATHLDENTTASTSPPAVDNEATEGIESGDTSNTSP